MDEIVHTYNTLLKKDPEEIELFNGWIEIIYKISLKCLKKKININLLNNKVKMGNYENLDDYYEEMWFDSIKYYRNIYEEIYRKFKEYILVGSLYYENESENECENEDNDSHNWHIKWKNTEEKDKHNSKKEKNKGNKGKGLYYKENNNNKRKKTDYQFTELLVALMLLGLKDKYTYEDITKFSNEMFEEEKLICRKEILDKYYEDLKSSYDKKTFKNSYIDNFIKKLDNHQELDLDNIEYVHLTGKSYKNHLEILEQNKDYERMNPNSDVYFKVKDIKLLWGISCKQTSGCPCTNKVVEKKKKILMELREKLLNDNDINKDNYEKHRSGKSGDGKIATILSTKDHYCGIGKLQEYWEELQKHIIDEKEYFIQGVIDSMCQGEILPYPVFEYDGEKIINTKDRKLEKDKCDIRISDIFCWGILNPREASKIWFDFMYDDEIKYRLEVRFKGKYFGEGGQPQLFIYKELDGDIKKYIKTREKFKSKNPNIILNSNNS